MTRVTRVLFALLLLAAGASSQESAASAPTSRLDTRARALVRELWPPFEAQLGVAANAPLPQRAAEFERLAKVIEAVRSDFPRLEPWEREGPAWRKFEREGVQKLLGAFIDSLSRLVANELESRDDARRAAALHVIEALGPDARALLPALIDLILSAGYGDVERVTEVARKVGGLESGFVAPLVEALRTGEAFLRRHASAALATLAEDAPDALVPAVAQLGASLSDPDEVVRQWCAEALHVLGSKAAGVRQSIRAAAARTDDAFVRRDAALALNAIDPSDPIAVPGLVVALDGGFRDFDQAIEALRRMGPAAATALPALAARRGDSEWDRFRTLRTIAAIDGAGAVAVPRLIEAAGKPEELAQELAIEALVSFAPRSAEARAWLEAAVAKAPEGLARVARLRAAPGDADAAFGVFEAMHEAAPCARSFDRALRHLRSDCRAGVRMLGKALEQSDPELQAAALHKLPIFGSEGAPVLPQVRALLGHPNPAVRMRAGACLPGLDPSGAAVLGDLTGRLSDFDSRVREAAVEAIAELGSRAAGASEALTRLVAERDGDERLHARIALARIGGDSRTLVSELVSDLLGPWNDFELWQKIVDLEKAEPPPLPPVDALVATLAREGESADAIHAMLLLARHGERAALAVPALVARLGASGLRVRTAAAYALGSVGPAARDTVPALCESLEAIEGDRTGSTALVDAIIRALAWIGPDARYAIPCLRRFDRRMTESTVERIDPPVRRPLTVRLDPALRICEGRWLEDRTGAGNELLPVRIRVMPEVGGVRSIGIRAGLQDEGYQALRLMFRKTEWDVLVVTGDHGAWSMDTPSSYSPIENGTIVLRSLDFGKGVPLQALVSFESDYLHATYEVSFTALIE